MRSAKSGMKRRKKGERADPARSEPPEPFEARWRFSCRWARYVHALPGVDGANCLGSQTRAGVPADQGPLNAGSAGCPSLPSRDPVPRWFEVDYPIMTNARTGPDCATDPAPATSLLRLTSCDRLLWGRVGRRISGTLALCIKPRGFLSSFRVMPYFPSPTTTVNPTTTYQTTT
jgi:hypothetical protein